jgi:hypothetical protein
MIRGIGGSDSAMNDATTTFPTTRSSARFEPARHGALLLRVETLVTDENRIAIMVKRALQAVDRAFEEVAALSDEAVRAELGADQRAAATVGVGDSGVNHIPFPQS